MTLYADKTRSSASQRDRTTLCAIEYFAKSLKVTQGHSKWHSWVRRVYVPIGIPLKLCLYLVPFMIYSSSKNGVTLKPEYESFKVIENGAVRYTIHDFLLVSRCNYTSIVPILSYLTLNNIVNLKSGLEVTQDHSNWYHAKAWVTQVGCSFLFAFHSNYGRIINRLRYSASRYSVSLKTGLGRCSRSLKMVRFDRPCMTFY